MNFVPARRLVPGEMNSGISTAGSAPGLSREQILAAFGYLSDKLREKNVVGELCLFGGTVMVLAYNARISTKDVDAVFQPTAAIRSSAVAVADEQNLPSDWLNDGVKGFLSANHNLTHGNLPQYSHLRLTMPVPEYLLAMKCMAGRIGGATGEGSDIPDIQFLLRHLNLKTAEETLRIVAAYYPANQIPVKTQFLVESLFQEEKA
jgi:hypothetical protein